MGVRTSVGFIDRLRDALLSPSKNDNSCILTALDGIFKSPVLAVQMTKALKSEVGPDDLTLWRKLLAEYRLVDIKTQRVHEIQTVITA